MAEALLRKFKLGCFQGVRVQCLFTQHVPADDEWDPGYGGTTYFLLTLDWTPAGSKQKKSRSLVWQQKLRKAFDVAFGPPPKLAKRAPKVLVMPV